MDGLDTRPGNAKPGSGDAEGQPLYWSKFVPRRDILESEDRVIKRIVEAFEDEHSGPVVALTQRDWMFSSVDALEFAVIDQLLSVAPNYNQPQAADYILPTLLDVNALSPTEHYTVRILNSLFKHNEALLEAILEKEWAQDGFTVDETDAIWELFRMDFYLQEESDYAFTVLEMPFLDDIEPFDKKAVEALNELQWHSVTRLATNFNLFWYVVEHEALSDGIEDDDVLKISVLDEFAVAVRRSDHAQFDASAILEGLDDILLPGAIEIEEGFVQLPNDRRATVRIFRPEAISLESGTMAGLTDLLDDHIAFLDIPLDETDYTVVGQCTCHLSDDRAVYRAQWPQEATAAMPFDQWWLSEAINSFVMYSSLDGTLMVG